MEDVVQKVTIRWALLEANQGPNKYDVNVICDERRVVVVEDLIAENSAREGESHFDCRFHDAKTDSQYFS